MLAAEEPDVPVRIITSARRKKSVAARWVGDTIEIRLPEGLSASQQDRHVRALTVRLVKKRSAGRIDLTERAQVLAATYDLPEPSSITWSSRQQQRWGSCTPSTGAIRISDRMGAFPQWVIDHVILHELAHLVVADHSPAFYELLSGFPDADRAEGFLLAVSLGHGGTFSTCD